MTCEWTEDEDGYWDTGCGELFQFNDDGPAENRFKFCPYCGGELKAVPIREDET